MHQDTERVHFILTLFSFKLLSKIYNELLAAHLQCHLGESSMFHTEIFSFQMRKKTELNVFWNIPDSRIQLKGIFITSLSLL